MDSPLRGMQRQCFQPSLIITIIAKDKFSQHRHAITLIHSKGRPDILASKVFPQDRKIPTNKVNIRGEQEEITLTDRYLQATK